MKLSTAVLLGASVWLSGCTDTEPAPQAPGQQAEAITITGELFPTGVDASGAALAVGVTDSHYTIVASDDPIFTNLDADDPLPAPSIVTTPNAAWDTSNATSGTHSQWISLSVSNAGANNASYTYRTSFLLSAVDPATATITGSYEADDAVALYVNGSTTATSTSTDPAYHAPAQTFTVAAGPASGLIAGTNTLDFTVTNTGNGPTGLRILKITLTANCDADSQCGAGNYCNELAIAANNTCATQVANGTLMPNDPNHTSPTLTTGCTPTNASVICASGVCSTPLTIPTCGYQLGMNAAACTTDAQCAPNVCSSDGTCILTGTCDTDTDCNDATKYCDLTGLTTSHTCQPKANTGVLVPGGLCPAGGTTDRCLAGVCSTTDNECGLSNGQGGCTIGNASGTSGVCQSGVCDPNANAGAGLCEQCTPTQSAACTGTTPVCDATSETCVACNGDDGTIATDACPTTTAPYCGLLGCGLCGVAGQNLTCTSTLGDLHAGATCQANGACANSCLVDANCTVATQYCPSNGTTAAACTAKVTNGQPIPSVPGHTPTLDGNCYDDVTHGDTGSDVCASGVCDGTLCGYANGDGPCPPSTSSPLCQSGQCSANGKCEPSGGCLVDLDCSGGAFCNASDVCQLPPPTITTPLNGSTLPAAGNYAITGTGIPGDTIVVSVNGTVVGTVTVNGAGVWTLMSAAFGAGTDVVTAVQKPSSGSAPVASNAATSTVTVLGPVMDMSGADMSNLDLGEDMAGPVADLSASAPDLAGARYPSFAGGGLTCEMGSGRAPASNELFLFGLLCAIALAYRQRVRLRRLIAALAIVAALLPAAARADNHTFSVGRYEPTPAGEWSFSVDHPWYSSTRFFAAGFTLDYAHNPLVAGYRNQDGSFTETSPIIANALIGHFDLAASFLDRVTLSFSLPVTFFENGNFIEDVGPQSGQVGDPRLGIMIRLVGQPDRSAFSLSLGGYVWIPVGAHSATDGDDSVRVLPKLVAAGLGHHIRYSSTFGFLYRPVAQIGNLPAGSGNTVGSEIQFGALVQYADVQNRWAIGPEGTLATVVNDGHAFHKSFTSLEILLGLHYNVVKQLQLGVAAGIGLLREPGNPDFRALFRIAYAPIREKKAPPPVYEAPPPPPPDRDHDGVIDALDLCPDVPQGARPDPDRPGCPMGDRDHDGILDGDDLCPDVPFGLHPDPKRRGCPAADTDGDGVYDPDDLCPTVPMGEVPDPNRLGCPLPDRDGDRVADDVDACPDQPGAPSPDPKKNGCPGLVQIKNGQLVILKPVFFSTNKDTILPQSFPVLQAVADALTAQPSIKHIAIEGHTDDRGKPAKNLDLSERRAKSVLRFLVAHNIPEDRLEAHGYGQERPLSTNRTVQGRAINRRVEFHILDAQPPTPAQGDSDTATPSPTP